MANRRDMNRTVDVLQSKINRQNTDSLFHAWIE